MRAREEKCLEVGYTNVATVRSDGGPEGEQSRGIEENNPR
jgi:hypothetical protein